MNEQSSYETLMKLIDDIEIMRPPERDIYFNTANAWRCELHTYPDRFRMDNGELLWLGYRVGIIGSQRSQNKFWRMVNRYVVDGIIGG